MNLKQHNNKAWLMQLTSCIECKLQFFHFVHFNGIDFFFCFHSEHNYPTDPAQTSPEVVSTEHICSKSIYLELKLQRARETISKLQKRCADKTAEIGRLKSAVKRLAVSKTNLKELIEDIKQKNMISEQGHQNLIQVNLFNL